MRIKLIILSTLLLSINCTSLPTSQLTSFESDGITIYNQDVAHFWSTYDTAKNQSQNKQIEIFDNEYYKAGSQGLKDFYELRINDSKELVKAINAVPAYYEAIRPFTSHIEQYASEIKKNFKRFKQLYPNTKDSNVYFLIGRLTTAGTVKDNNLLIGLDLFGNDIGIDRKIIPQHIQLYNNSPQKLPAVVMHELIHAQQENGDIKTLLEISINEGSADFLTELTMGTHPYKNLYEYGYKNEAKIWKKFKKKMNGTDVTEFLYNVSTAKNPDLGYFVGYRITESFYKNAIDKKKAIKDLLTEKNLKAIFDQSGYDPQ